MPFQVDVGQLLSQFMPDMLGRLDGPGTLRLFLQPLVAMLLGLRDGHADARAGRPPYLLALFVHKGQRRATAKQGARSIAKTFVVAIVVDAILSYITMRAIYPGQTLLVAIILVALPYSLARAAGNRALGDRVQPLGPPPGAPPHLWAAAWKEYQSPTRSRRPLGRRPSVPAPAGAGPGRPPPGPGHR